MKFFICGIIGVSGSGKTYFAEALVREHERVIIVDYQHDEKFDAYEIITRISDVREALFRDEFAVALRFTHDIDYFTALDIISANAKNAIILLDELSVYAPTTNTPDSIKNVFFRGRRKGLVVIWTSQRPHSVSVDARSQTHTFVVFKTLEKRDLQYLDIERVKWNAIRNLPVGKYILLRDERALIEFLKLR